MRRGGLNGSSRRPRRGAWRRRWPGWCREDQRVLSGQSRAGGSGGGGAPARRAISVSQSSVRRSRAGPGRRWRPAGFRRCRGAASAPTGRAEQPHHVTGRAAGVGPDLHVAVAGRFVESGAQQLPGEHPAGARPGAGPPMGRRRSTPSHPRSSPAEEPHRRGTGLRHDSSPRGPKCRRLLGASGQVFPVGGLAPVVPRRRRGGAQPAADDLPAVCSTSSPAARSPCGAALTARRATARGAHPSTASAPSSNRS